MADESFGMQIRLLQYCEPQASMANVYTIFSLDVLK